MLVSTFICVSKEWCIKHVHHCASKSSGRHNTHFPKEAELYNILKRVSPAEELCELLIVPSLKYSKN